MKYVLKHLPIKVTLVARDEIGAVITIILVLCEFAEAHIHRTKNCRIEPNVNQLRSMRG